MSLVIEGDVDFYTEDGGAAAIAEVGEGGGAFVRIQEYNHDPSDNTFVPTLAGKRVRVTIEVL